MRAPAATVVEGAVNLRVVQVEGLPLLAARPDRDAMARVGLTAQDVFDTLAAAVAGQEAGTVYKGDRRFDVVVKLNDAARNDIETLRKLPVLTPSGAFVPLGSVATLETSKGPNQIGREDGKRRAVVQANVRGRDIAGVVKDAQAEIDAKVQRPPGVWPTWGGQFENLERPRERLAVVGPACFALIAVLLYSAVGSWRAAAVVFTGVSLALIGGIAALWARGLPFSISAAVGFIALSGVALLNGLVMIGAIDELAKSQPWAEAVRAGADDGRGGVARFRTDGGSGWCRRGGAATIGHGGNWWALLGDLAHIVRAACNLRMAGQPESQ